MREVHGELTRTKVLLVDPREFLVEGLRLWLNRSPAVEVVGTALTGRAAVELTFETSPDIVIMCLAIPQMCGIETTREIIARRPVSRVLCMINPSEGRPGIELLRAGASGCMFRSGSVKELSHAMRVVQRGQIYLCPEIASLMVRDFWLETSSLPKSSPLSPRQRRVLQLLAEGSNTNEIARQLRLSIRTIGSCRNDIMQTLRISSVAGLTKYAVKHRLTALEC